MVSQSEPCFPNLLLCPDHVIGAIIKEQVDQLPLWICLSAEELKLAVVSTLAGSEPHFSACSRKFDDQATAI